MRMRPLATLRFMRGSPENKAATYSVAVVRDRRIAQILTQPANLCNARASVRDLGHNAWDGPYFAYASTPLVNLYAEIHNL